MSEDRFDTVCKASVKLVEQLKGLLRSHGLGSEDAANVLAMAAGGIIKSTEVDPEQFMQAAYIAYQMWRQEEDVDGIDGAIFDPPHKRVGYAPPSRDHSAEN